MRNIFPKVLQEDPANLEEQPIRVHPELMVIPLRPPAAPRGFPRPPAAPNLRGPARAMTTSSVWPRSFLMFVNLSFREPLDVSMPLTLAMSRPCSLINYLAL